MLWLSFRISTPYTIRVQHVGQRLIRFTNLYPHGIQTFIRELDRLRARLLFKSLKVRIFRDIYSSRALRLGAGFLLMTAFYLPISISRPELLLVLGPLLFGFPHLIASYRFVRGHLQDPLLQRFNDVQVFCTITAIAIFTQVLAVRSGLFSELPYGAWEIFTVCVGVFGLRFFTKNIGWKSFIICLGFNFALLRLSWYEPILFAGGILILHNWIAFVYWIVVSKERSSKLTATASLILFGFIHYLVFSGWVDGFFPTNYGALAANPSAEITGWYLASWSNDPVVWYRAVVLYTFGLSLHYFVWLKAIPESMTHFEHPNCFRLTFEKLHQDVGHRTLIFLFALFALMLGLWLISTEIGAKIYFTIAAMHGWLEITALTARRSPTLS